MISTSISDLFLFIFTLLCCYYYCTRNILLLWGMDNEAATVRVFFVSEKLTKIWISLLSFWEYCILWQKVRSMSRKRIFSQPSLQSLFDYSWKNFRETFIPSERHSSVVTFSTFYSLPLLPLLFHYFPYIPLLFILLFINFEFSLDDPN